MLQMPTWHTVATTEELISGRRKLCEIEGRRLALFRIGDEVVAIDNHCPHRGGPLGAGPLEGSLLTCPWHGLAFDLSTGQCAGQGSMSVIKLAVRVVDDEIQVDLDSGQRERDERI